MDPAVRIGPDGGNEEQRHTRSGRAHKEHTGRGIAGGHAARARIGERGSGEDERGGVGGSPIKSRWRQINAFRYQQ